MRAGDVWNNRFALRPPAEVRRISKAFQFKVIKTTFLFGGEQRRHTNFDTCTYRVNLSVALVLNRSGLSRKVFQTFRTAPFTNTILETHAVKCNTMANNNLIKSK